MRKVFTSLALSLLLLASVVPHAAAAEQKYLLQADFEDQTVGTAPKEIGAISIVPLAGSIDVVELDGNKVLALRRTSKNGNTAAYLDILGRSKEFKAEYCISYDIMIPEKQPTAGGWQLACSRQESTAGTQFQQAGDLNIAEGAVKYGGTTVATLEFGKWYNLAAVFSETTFTYDVYVDGKLVIDAASYTIDTNAKYPERLRIGQSASTGDCLVYVDNIKVYNAAQPVNITPADIRVLTPEEAAEEAKSYDFALPVWTHQYDVNTIIVISVGSVSIVLVAVLGALILKRGKKVL